MAAISFPVFLLTILALTHAHKDYTVTEEVFFDVEIKDYEDGEDYRGRFVVGVFGDKCPVTAMNFMSLAKGFKKLSAKTKKLHYKETPIHRIVPDFIIQMGDVTSKNGVGGESIYGSQFADENFDISHRAAGYVAMANKGTDTNGSQFFITLNKARWLDGKHVVFGKVIRGMDVIRTIGEIPVNDQSEPKKKVKIVDSGLMGIPKKYELKEKQMDSDNDIDDEKPVDVKDSMKDSP